MAQLQIPEAPEHHDLDDTVAAGLTAEAENQFFAIVRRFFRNRLAVVGLVVLVVLGLVAIFAPQLASQPLDARVDVPNRFQPPGDLFPLGSDSLGRDVLSRMIWASRVSLSVGFVAMFVAVAVGTFIGALAGFFGGSWLDIILMRIAEAIDLIPILFLLITVLAVIGGAGLNIGGFHIPNIYTMMFILGITSWPSLAMIVRGQFLSLRQRDFSEASRALGASRLRIMFRHILPNAVAPIIVSATFRVGGAILTESSLSFLGLGTQPPEVSWGQILALGRTYITNAPWLIWWPGLAILITVLAFNFVGDGLRDALDPRMKL